MHLQVALQAFLLQLQADGRSPHTVGQYRRHGTALVTWLAAAGAGTSVADLTPELLARFFAADSASQSCRGGPKKAVSLNAMRTSIRCLCAHLRDAGLVAANPARLLRRARCAPPPPRALHPDEQKRLVEVLAAAAGPEASRDHLLVELLLGCGVRLGSALALDVGDIDLAHGEISLRTTKNNRPATVLVPKPLAKKLARFVHGRAEGPVFLAGERRISTRHAQRRLSGWFAKAGITGRSAHSLRHSFAMRVYGKTGDLLTTQFALGHASIASTCIYARTDKARLRTAIGA